MPFCDVGRYQNLDGAAANSNNGIKIFYRTYGKGPIKVLMIIGKRTHSNFFENCNSFDRISWVCDGFRDDQQIIVLN